MAISLTSDFMFESNRPIEKMLFKGKKMAVGTDKDRPSIVT